VADDGKGMEPAVVARIFEPFFTTKGVGEGTGLGLSTVYAVVDQHGGWIEVVTAPDHGSTFAVYLPALDASNEQDAEYTRPSKPVLTPGRGQSILLVEDEPFLRETAALVATRAGYLVTQAADGPSALQAWKEAARPFDMLLTDLMMPNGLTGIQLAAQLRAEQPALKVIFSTGYNDELLRSGASAIEGTHLLLKPYSGAELLEMLNQALQASQRRATPPPFGSKGPFEVTIR
jgi:two-component system cell cycle sensor histidine kinase/response regulator CckA